MAVVAAGLLATAVSPAAGATGWRQLTPPTSPPARAYATSAYDIAHRVVVLFGGFDGFTRLNDTWTWDGATWTQQHPATSPPARNGAAMAYDPFHGQVVLFGGYDGHGYLGDTWIWDGLTWTQHAGPGPVARTGARMAADPENRGVLLFGGFYLSGVNGVYPSDTWHWNGSGWSALSPATSPPGRASPGLDYDGHTHRILLFGGLGVASPPQLSDTWTWDGLTWKQEHPSASPPGRYDTGMAFDVRVGRTILFGGYTGPNFTYFSDTWAWNGVTWLQATLSVSPSPREGFALASDLARGRLLLFGGAAPPSSAFTLRDTWTI